MKQFRWLTALPVALAMAILGAPASASSIRDQAGMFSAGAISAATGQLEQFEKATKVPVIIETVDSLSLGAEATKAEKHQAIEKLAIARDRETGNRGIFLLISKADRVISNTLIPRHLATALGETSRVGIRDAFAHGVGAHMKAEGHKSAEISDQDAGLKSLVTSIELTTEQVRGAGITGHANPIPNNQLRPRQGAGPVAARGGGSSMMTFLMIGAAILAVLFVVRLLGGLFGSRNQSGMGGMPGQGMRGPGYGGPGYGGPGYGGGGGGGGFLSGMMGGIGGALAGNWLYDQMSGRNSGTHTDASSYPTSGDSGGYYSQGDEPIVGGDDGGSGGGDWGGGGGDSGGGGDWGGGDGGGDWGGGGGDGGGDW